MPEGSGFAKIVAANKVVLTKPGCAEKSGVGGAAKFFETKVNLLNQRLTVKLFQRDCEWPWSFSSFTFHFNLFLFISVDHML